MEEKQEAKAKNLSEFGYHYVNQDGKTRLVNKADNKPFVFQGPDHYTELSKFVREEVMHRLRNAGLVEASAETAARCISARSLASKPDLPRIFHSPQAFTTPGVLMVILQGSGAVRTGLWAQRLAISESLESGTVLPFLERAKQRGWEVLCLDPNYADPKKDGMPQSVSAVEHVLCSFDHLLASCPARQIVFVCHSAGGQGILELLRHRTSLVLPRTVAVALTDAVHTSLHAPFTVPDPVLKFLASHSRDWVASNLPLDSPVKPSEDNLAQGMRSCFDSGDPISLVSAGSPDHIWTSYCAMESIFAFLDSELK
mmetsp:Transcript_41427/g.81209  ORF Transcript_41427/g.81209 Transcript_41427/m.81209 type:complete len:313 (+) Transcript_41427:31-969(+)|eukprot:CAMPEP_0175145772 /NCGR_PEP_ID=MMETSP0087-20121206/14979_1 /TAXON_ID=136419 /ORGANISM="Unknown Unknown, Strain D1" /LENGTH=312 /DNA_ID=CAMNT_0016430601 /DNA_START=240 /DNA_END=1178 /DNA_ORIENTATION=-